jgi:hypothetical protein
MPDNISEATKQNFIQLKNYMHTYKPLYSKIIGKGEALFASITGDDLEDTVKESIFEGFYKAKEWYNFYSVLEEKFNLSSDIDLTENTGIKALLGSLEFSIRGLKDQTKNLLETVSAVTYSLSSNSFWGFEMQSDMWLDNLYDQISLLDELYGEQINKNILDTLSAISANTVQLEEIYDNLNSLKLTQSFGIYKSNKNIDKDRIIINLVSLNATTPIDADVTENLEFKNGLSQLSFDDGLPEGNYLLSFSNKNTIELSNMISLEDGRYSVRKVDRNIIGWLINYEYPIIRFESGESRDIITIGNSFDVFFNSSLNFAAYDYYIEPFSVFMEAKINKADAIYDFFYGDYIDELVDESDEKTIYNRKIYDVDDKLLAIYKMTVRKNENGIPDIQYEKIQ